MGAVLVLLDDGRHAARDGAGHPVWGQPGIVAEIISGIERRGGRAVQDPTTDLVRVNGEFNTSVVLGSGLVLGS